MDATIKYLTELGHQYNPLFGGRYDRFDWSNITIADDPGRNLVRSFQMMMFPEHEQHVRDCHGANSVAEFDGLVDEATARTLDPVRTPRCGHPDYHLNAGETFGGGAWGKCVSEYPNNYGYYFYIKGSPPSSYGGRWESIKKAVTDAYMDMGFAPVETKDRSKANSVWSFDLRRPGIIGLASVPDARGAANCSRGYFLQCDPTYAPGDEREPTLWAHELGHNVRSGHISGDPVMHPGIRSGWNLSFRNTTFGNRLENWYDGKPIIGDKPPPPPPPSGDTLDGWSQWIRLGDKPKRKYKLVLQD